MSKKCIDVSEWQGTINWEAVKNEIDVAILRVGYGDNIEKQDDKTFKANADACTKLGIPFGVYLYSYATNTEKAKSEAEHVLRLIKGYNLALPVYYDLEDAGTTAKCSNEGILAISKVFAETIKSAGYEVGFYANKSWWTTRLTDSYYNGFSRWVAQWASECTYAGSYDVWQYSSSGTVTGINGRVDMNICYRDIVKPNEKPTPAPTQPVKSTYSVGDEVTIVGDYASSAYADKAGNTVAKGKKAYIVKIYEGTNYPYQLGAVKGNTSSSNTIGFAKESSISKGSSQPTKPSTPAKTTIKVGDKVKIVGAYASSAYGTRAGNTVAKGREAYIVKIYEGTNFPYQLGAKSGDASSSNTIGFAKESSIAKL